MKTIVKIIISIMLLPAISSCSPRVVENNRPVVVQSNYDTYNSNNNNNFNNPPHSYQMFYDELGPYGEWVEYPQYGYVWHPNVEPDFVPYSSAGHWVFTESGWMWASDYRWGWATFHYGRWFFDDMYGWIWVPGHEWAPAWVTWGQYNSYYCWAPIGPNVVVYEGYRPPVHYWTYCNREHITEINVTNYYQHNTTIINNNITNIVIINNSDSKSNDNRGYNRGPRRDEVEKHTRRTIIPVRITDGQSPKIENNNNSRKDEIVVYRPSIEKNTSSRIAPTKVENIKNLKQINRPANNGASDVKVQPDNQNIQKENIRQNDRPLDAKPANIPNTKDDQIQRNTPERPAQQKDQQRQLDRPQNIKPTENPNIRREPTQQNNVPTNQNIRHNQKVNQNQNINQRENNKPNHNTRLQENVNPAQNNNPRQNVNPAQKNNSRQNLSPVQNNNPRQNVSPVQSTTPRQNLKMRENTTPNNQIRKPNNIAPDKSVEKPANGRNINKQIKAKNIEPDKKELNKDDKK